MAKCLSKPYKFGAPQLSKPNDPSWYAKDAQLLKDTASFPFSIPAGNPVNITSTDEHFHGLDYVVPGVMALYMKPCIGRAVDGTDAINIAARNIYTFVRHQNSGHTNYEASDLMMYLMAMSEIYSFHAWCVRLYGIARLYQQTNKYLPDGLLEAMYVDRSVVMDLPKLRSFINLTRRKFAATAVPNSMPYINRKIWLYSGIYTDAESPKAQMYVFQPVGFYQFEFGELGKLTFKPFGRLNLQQTNKLTLQDLTNYADSLINAVMTDEDMGIMSGDILKAFGDSGIYKVAEMSEDYEIVPTYSHEVLTQIENTVILSNYIATGTEAIDWDIHQNAEIGGGYLYCSNDVLYKNSFFGGEAQGDPTVLPSYGPGADQLIDLDSVHPSPEEVMIATRLKPSVTGITAESVASMDGSAIKYTYHVGYVGADMCIAADYITYSPNSKRYVVTRANPSWMSHSTTTTEVVNNKDTVPLSQVMNICTSTNFNYHPIQYLTYVPLTDKTKWNKDATETLSDVVSDVNVYTTITPIELGRMHEVAMMSMFDVPMMGAWSNK